MRLPLRLAPFTDAPSPSRPVAGVRPTRILLVEDQAAMARMLAALLERRGHQVHVAYDGPSALEMASDLRPELVLLDIGLPGMDGYEVARRLRTLPELSRSMVVALTGYGREEDRRRSHEAGCAGHLVKPVSFAALDKLFTEVERMAGGAAAGAGGAWRRSC